MFNHFKLPNYIFEYDLTANEIATLAVLFSLHSKSYRVNMVRITQERIAKRIGAKKSTTISRAIDNLVRKGLILRVDRFLKLNKHLGTYVYSLPCTGEFKQYFYVNRNIFKKNLSAVQLRMYLYLCKCAQSKTLTCWNSYNDLAAGLHLHRSSVIKTINELIDLQVIERINVVKQDGSYSDNHYKILSIKVKKSKYFAKRKKPHVLHSIAAFSHKYSLTNTFSPKYFSIFYNSLLLSHCQAKNKSPFKIIRGSPFKGKSINSTHLYPTEKEIYN